jgi:coproporphyrinogen III oxidase-like Fe-S oxidoreductase
MKKFQKLNDSLFQKIEEEKTKFIKANVNQIYGGSGQPCTITPKQKTLCSVAADGKDPV